MRSQGYIIVIHNPFQKQDYLGLLFCLQSWPSPLKSKTLVLVPARTGLIFTVTRWGWEDPEVPPYVIARGRGKGLLLLISNFAFCASNLIRRGEVAAWFLNWRIRFLNHDNTTIIFCYL